MLRCDEAQLKWEEYLAQSLPAAERVRLEAHLASCARCRRSLREAQLARQVLHQISDITPPPHLAAQIKYAAHWRQAYGSQRWQRALGSPVFLATCASLFCGALLCLLAIWHLSSIKPEPSMEAPLLVTMGGAGQPCHRVIVQTTVSPKLTVPSRRAAVRPARPHPAHQPRAMAARPGFSTSNQRASTRGATRLTALPTVDQLSRPVPGNRVTDTSADPRPGAGSQTGALPIPQAAWPGSRQYSQTQREVSLSPCGPDPLMLKASAAPEMGLTMCHQRVSVPGDRARPEAKAGPPTAVLSTDRQPPDSASPPEKVPSLLSDTSD